MHAWDDLKKFIREGETFLASEESHIAILVARLMHHERLKAAIVAPVSPLAAVPPPPTEPAPTPAETPAGTTTAA
jgi:hypothetical protein